MDIKINSKWARAHKWQDDANCNGVDPTAFDRVSQTRKRPWEAWCSNCPVKTLCLQQGLEEDASMPSGVRGHAPMVYGGLTPKERQALSENKLHFHRLRLAKILDARSRHENSPISDFHTERVA